MQVQSYFLYTFTAFIVLIIVCNNYSILHGEKYGDAVRMITFDPDYSRELCGGCHVDATGRIGQFKITGETAIASGVRRIEASTGHFAEQHINEQLDQLEAIRGLFKNPTQAKKQVQDLILENKALQKEVDRMVGEALQAGKSGLKEKLKDIGGINFLASEVSAPDSSSLKSLAYELEKEIGDAVIVFGALINERPQLLVAISDNLIKERNLHAGNMVRELAQEIAGGGGGQPFFATAGGKDISGIPRALEKAEQLVTVAVS